MKKIFTMMAALLLGASSMMAQKDGVRVAIEAGAGTELEVGARAEYGFSKYLSWDILHAKYAWDYNKDYNFNEFTLTTGLRGFSPSFGPNLKAFAAIDLGYGVTFRDFTTHNFALDFTVGLNLGKDWYVGYGLGYMANDGKHKDHLFRIGYYF